MRELAEVQQEPGALLIDERISGQSVSRVGKMFLRLWIEMRIASCGDVSYVADSGEGGRRTILRLALLRGFSDDIRGSV